MPLSPDAYLSGLLKKYRDHAEHSKQGGKVHLIYEICSAISEYSNGQDLTTTASERGWPLEISFEEIPRRIMNFKIQINAMIANEFVLNDSLAWKKFVSNLKTAKRNMADFRKITIWSKFRAVGANAHAG